jgi:hypothetical protein
VQDRVRAASTRGPADEASARLIPFSRKDPTVNQSDLIQSVARATGESPRRVRRMGFLLVVPAPATGPSCEEARPGPDADHDAGRDAHAPRPA